jgi:hypothetical protein
MNNILVRSAATVIAWLFTTSFLVSQEKPDMGSKKMTSLIIIGHSAEFIVLKSDDNIISWMATQAKHPTLKENSKYGAVDNKTINLLEVFDTVQKLEDSNIDNNTNNTTNYFSLIIISNNETKSCLNLNVQQRAKLRSTLSAVFNDIYKNGQYTKINVLEELLLDNNNIRSTTTPNIPPGNMKSSLP